MKKKSSIIKLSVVGVLLVFGLLMSFVPVNFGNTKFTSFSRAIKQGLDLKGGIYAVYEIDNYQSINDFQTKRNGTITRLESLIAAQNYSEATVVADGANRIRAEIPDVDDAGDLLEIIGQPARLEFILEGTTDPVISGEHVQMASIGTDPEDGSFVVQLSLNREGAERFGKATTENIGKNMAIVVTVNGQPPQTISNATIRAAITNGQAVISGGFTRDSAQDLVNQISAGQFELTLSLIESSTISPTLGQRALFLSLLAGIIAFAIVIIFMCLVYRMLGGVASFSLLIYMVLMFFFLAVIPGVQLTLPGIAGIILSFGMAVDANIIIFERIKDEYRNGKSILASYYAGFKKALLTILDSNVTTLIAAIVLWIFGTGSVQGFAITLFIGILLSMITAIFISKFILKQVLNLNSTNEKMYRLKRGEGFEGLESDITDISITPEPEKEKKSKKKKIDAEGGLV